MTTTVVSAEPRSDDPGRRATRAWATLPRNVWRTGSGKWGLVLLGFILLLSFVGPHFAPYGPTTLVGAPYSKPSAPHLLGTDALGRDVLSRFLHGGETIIGIAFLATVLAYVVAIPVGMATGLRKGGLFDRGTMAVVDIGLAFPPIIFVLVLLAAAGSGIVVVVIAIAMVHAPRVSRVVRAVTLEISAREFIEAAVTRGERAWSLLAREVLPNIWTPVLADFGLRLTGSIILYASLSYLGLAAQPPAANWGLMISENKDGLFINPWAVVAPAAAIAILSIAVNLVSDAIARSLGRSVVATGRD